MKKNIKMTTKILTFFIFFIELIFFILKKNEIILRERWVQFKMWNWTRIKKKSWKIKNKGNKKWKSVRQSERKEKRNK